MQQKLSLLLWPQLSLRGSTKLQLNHQRDTKRHASTFGILYIQPCVGFSSGFLCPTVCMRTSARNTPEKRNKLTYTCRLSTITTTSNWKGTSDNKQSWRCSADATEQKTLQLTRQSSWPFYLFVLGDENGRGWKASRGGEGRGR